jgi:hypothetical protein
MIKSTTLTAIYDGIKQVEIKCKINTETKEVFDIKVPDVVNNFNCFTGFYFNVDGALYPIESKNDAKENEYWYKQY